MDIKRVIKEYCEQFYAHKFDNLYEMDQFQRYSMPKLTEEIDNVKRPIYTKEVK